MRIVFDPSTLHQSKKGSVTGIVYFDFSADRQFPVAGWNDLVVVLATWWIDALEKIIQGQVEAEFRFMDGPYWITAVRRGTGLLLRCTEDRRGAESVYEFGAEMGDLERELTGFARQVSDACARARIKSADLDQLRRHLPN